MKRLLCIILLSLAFTACKKDDSELLQKDNNLQAASIDNVGPMPVPPYQWSSLSVPGNIDAHIDGSYNQVIEVNDNKYALLGFWVYKSLYKLNKGTMTWAQSNDFNHYPYSRIMFSRQSKIYIGFTSASTENTDVLLNDFKSYDVSTGVTTTLASFPGTAVFGATYFVIGSKAYIMGGRTPDDVLINQFWEYNFSTNQWTNKGNSPLGKRVNASVLVVDSKAYFGLGYDYVLFNGVQLISYKKDWMLFDPATSSVTSKADFPGLRREGATGFVINNNPYLGLGRNTSTRFNDFYKYSTSSNTWGSITNWPGDVDNGSPICGGFSIGSSGFIIKSSLREFWRYSNSPLIVTGKQ